jgi:hypothetical protein
MCHSSASWRVWCCWGHSRCTTWMPALSCGTQVRAEVDAGNSYSAEQCKLCVLCTHTARETERGRHRERPFNTTGLSEISVGDPAGFWDRLLNRNQLIGLMAQGFQRDLGSAGEVLPLPAPSKQLLVSRPTRSQRCKAAASWQPLPC